MPDPRLEKAGEEVCVGVFIRIIVVQCYTGPLPIRDHPRKSAACYRLQSVAKFCKIALSMKAYVTVMLKTTVLDPQGKTIHGALKKMGYKGVAVVRQGKFFELNLDGGLDKNAAKAEVERIAKDVLTNPVIEEFTYRLEE
jgi:phosphoribosylformylglycinamidine synthase subunit PurS